MPFKIKESKNERFHSATGIFKMIDKRKLEIIAQLVEAMYDSYRKLESAYNDKDMEELNKAKKEIISLKNKISDSL